MSESSPESSRRSETGPIFSLCTSIWNLKKEEMKREKKYGREKERNGEEKKLEMGQEKK